MIVLLDESLPNQLAKSLPGHAVESVRSMQWLGVQNGSLMKLVAEFFEVFVTADKNIVHQQSMKTLPFAMVVLSTNHWPTLRMNVASIRDAIEATPTGQLRYVECGRFVSEKQRKKRQQEK